MVDSTAVVYKSRESSSYLIRRIRTRLLVRATRSTTLADLAIFFLDARLKLPDGFIQFQVDKGLDLMQGTLAYLFFRDVHAGNEADLVLWLVLYLCHTNSITHEPGFFRGCEGGGS